MSIQDQLKKALSAFMRQAPLDGLDPKLRGELSAAAGRLAAPLDQAVAALGTDDTARYARISSLQLSPQGASFSTLLETY